MKRKILLVLPIAFFILTSMSTITLAGMRGKNSESSFYSDSVVTVNSTVNNDLFAVGSDVKVNSNVVDNAFVAGSNVVINGDVSGNLLVAGFNVEINGNIVGDLLVTGGSVNINSKIIRGDVYLSAGNSFISENTVIDGKIYKNSPETEKNEEKENKNGNFLESFFNLGLTIFNAIVLGLVVIKLFPVFVEKNLRRLNLQPRKSFLTGVITFSLTPVITLALILGFFSTLHTLFFFILLALSAYYLGMVIFQIKLGNFIFEKTSFLNKYQKGMFRDLVLGVIVFNLGYLFLDKFFTLTPGLELFGFFIILFTFFAGPAVGIGAIVLEKYSILTRKK